MTTVKQINCFIDQIAPFETAMDFDNCGLLVGDPVGTVTSVLLSLDITEEVVKEAKEKGAELIISHHPVIFKPLKRLMNGDIPYLLAKEGIHAICAHTNLDMADGGVNTCLADCLGLQKREPLSIYKTRNYVKIVVFVPLDQAEDVKTAMAESGAGALGNYERCSFSIDGIGNFLPTDGADPFVGEQGTYESVKETRVEMICAPQRVEDVIAAMKKVHPYEEPAYDIFQTEAIQKMTVCGLVGELEEVQLPEVFARYVKDHLRCSGVRYTEGARQIKRVAICSGAGGDFIYRAISCGADAFVTGEIKHHELLLAKKAGITVVDAGHFATEDLVIEPLLRTLTEQFPTVQFQKSEVFQDITKYC